MAVVNYYRNMQEIHSHTLAPLTKITSNKVKFKWNRIKQDAFDEIKQIVSSDTLLNYLNFNETFKIHTDSSNFQLGEVIIQNGKIVYFYTIKLT